MGEELSVVGVFGYKFAEHESDQLALLVHADCFLTFTHRVDGLHKFVLDVA